MHGKYVLASSKRRSPDGQYSRLQIAKELTWQTIMLAISLIRNQLSFQVIV